MLNSEVAENFPTFSEVLPTLRYVEYHLVEHCNLSCQRCGHFSPLAKPGFSDPEAFARDLRQLGFEVLPSLTNFVFARHRSRSGADLAAALRQRGVLVRHFGKPRIEDFLRITVGTEAQCGRLVEVLRGLI